MNESLKDVNTTFHTASTIDMRLSPSPLLYDVNITGTKNIFQISVMIKPMILNCVKNGYNEC